MTTILDTSQLAEALGLNAETIRRQVQAGTLPYHRIGNSLRFILEDVLAATRITRHPDDEAVDAFAAAMRERMATKREEGVDGWQERNPLYLSEQLLGALGKGSAVDVADWAMMLHALGATPGQVSSGFRLTLGGLEQELNEHRQRLMVLCTAGRALAAVLPQPETSSWTTYHAREELGAFRDALEL